jgi:hypothetical protein
VNPSLDLHEAGTPALPASSIRPDGLVPVVIIRPGIGRGKGRHLYEADMLAREVDDGRFKGWRMYVDHQSTEAKKALGGLPRSTKELGGVVRETWWDPSYSEPEDAQHGRRPGAVMGLAKPTRFMAALIEDIPEAIGTSISATATGVRQVHDSGQSALLVEGINPKGSVDWVTEAGAGGKVVALAESLQESATPDDEEEKEMLDGMTDEQALAYIKESRPDLYESLVEAADAEADDTDDDGDDKEKELVAKYEKKGLNKSMARKAAKRELQAAAYHEGGSVTTTELIEALTSEEGQEIVERIVLDRIDAVIAPRLGELVEAALADEREMMQAEADAAARRMLEVRDLRDKAHHQIAESRLPEPFQAVVRRQFDLLAGETPTPGLDVLADVDDDGVTVKSAEDKLTESVAAAVAEQRELWAVANPTRVRGQGPGTEIREAADDDPEGKKPTEDEKTTGSELTDHLLREGKFTEDDLKEMYVGI